MEKGAWVLLIIGIVFFAIISLMFVGLVFTLKDSNDGNNPYGNVALISVKGVITTERSDSLFGDSSASSQDIVELIEKADKNKKIKAIIIEIDSPGGSPVASDEIALAIEKTNKTTVALIREVGASGGYWVASSTDYIVANRMSITGSIGVIASYLEFAGLINDYNVSYQRLVSGKYKDMGTPFRELSQEEKSLFQKKLDMLHDFFVDEVAKNRNLPKDKVESLATGMFYLGSEAKELGLVDELGGKDEVIRYIEWKEGITVDIVEYKKERSFWDAFSEALSSNSFYVGKGIGSEIFKSGNPASPKIVT